MENPYEILGVAPKAPVHAIKAAYLRLARENHPDKGGDAAKMREAAWASTVLLEKRERVRVDERLRLAGRWPKKLCERCKGAGEVTVGGEPRQCGRCAGKGVQA